MKKVIFDYSIKPKVIAAECSNYEIEKLTYDELKGIMNGKLFVFFEPQRNYFILQTGIYDYLKQIQGIIEEIDQGNPKPFSVSCDWYSNNLNYEYEKENDSLRIIDVNEQKFDITTSYKSFRTSFNKFYTQTIEDLILLYPKLRQNNQFHR